MKYQYTFLQALQAFGYPIWLRHNRSYILSIVGVILTSICSYVAPSGLTLPETRSGLPTGHLWAYLLSGIVFFICFNMATKLSSLWTMSNSNSAPPEVRDEIKRRTASQGNGEGAKTGIFFSDVFLLPISTRDLVLVPLTISLLSAVSLAILYWLGVALPLHFDIPILLPLLLLCLVVTSSHASSWLMMSRPLFGCLFLPISMGVPVLAITAWLNHVPQLALSLPIGILAATSVWVSLRVAPLARNSVPTQGSISLNRKSKPLQTARKPSPISEPEAAQLTPLRTQVWMDLSRKLYLALPVLVAFSIVILFIVCLFGDPTPKIGLGIGDIQIGNSTRNFLLCIPICFGFAVMFSANSPMTASMNRTKAATKPGMDLFFATRPMPTAYFVGSKLIANIKATLGTSWVLGVSLTLWLLAPAQEGTRTGTLASILASHLSPHGLLLTGLVLFSIVFLLWSFLSGDPFRAILKGRFNDLLSYGPMIFLIVGINSFSDIAKMPLTEIGEFLRMLTPVTYALIVIKVILASIAIIRIYRQNLVDTSVLAKAGATWLLVSTFFVLSYVLLLPSGSLTALELAVVVILLMPANRILWSILRLDESRHQ